MYRIAKILIQLIYHDTIQSPTLLIMHSISGFEYICMYRDQFPVLYPQIEQGSMS